MNFFEHQARAKGQSRRLVFLFLLAVLGIVAAIDFVVLLAIASESDQPGLLVSSDAVPILIGSSLAVLAVIGVASLYRMATLSDGGAAVAQQLGATLVPPDTMQAQYRRLRNVVEEIAIASGTPVPQIFVLEHETGINAFAAGYAPTDAAVTVTRGALDKLSRDELQGVIAHEFSHILNGDMRLNIRLMGLLFGILVLAVIGRKLLRHGSGRSDSKSGAGFALIALAVMIVGYIGLFFGRLIKAGVSRTREFLADASAVQFTRQTMGIAGALKKAAGITAGTRLAATNREEVAHMLFGDGVGYSALFATHPALAARIRRLEPDFRVEQLDQVAQVWNAPGYVPPDEAMPGFVQRPMSETASLAPAELIAHVGNPGEDDYNTAHALRENMPRLWVDAAHDESRAPDVVMALLVQSDHGQTAAIETDWGADRARSVRALAQELPSLPRAQRLPLAAMTIPSLRRRPRTELQGFMRTLDVLIAADARVEVFEYALGRLVRHQLADILAPAAAARPGGLTLQQCSQALALVLAVLARAGHTDALAARRAFLLGVQHVLPRETLTYAPPEQWTLAMDRALSVLDRLQPMGKATVVEALVIVLSADGRVSVTEAELLRAVCGSLHVPLPAVLAS